MMRGRVTERGDGVNEGTADLSLEVRISDERGMKYECFGLSPRGEWWEANLKWTIVYEGVGSVEHGWVLDRAAVGSISNLTELAPAERNKYGEVGGQEAAVTELVYRSSATPACHIVVYANLVDEWLGDMLTPWFRDRSGSTEHLLEILSRRDPAGRPPAMYPSFANGEGHFFIHTEWPKDAMELDPEELVPLRRQESLADLWWRIPHGVVHATGILISDRIWLLPVGSSSQDARLVSFVFDRELPYPPAVLPSYSGFEYSQDGVGSRSYTACQGVQGQDEVFVEFVQVDRQEPGRVRLLADPIESANR